MNHLLLAAIQILPIADAHKKNEAFAKAQHVVEQSGLHFHVDNFEIAIEGSYEQIMRVVEAVQLSIYNAGIEELILNVRLHSNKTKDVKLKK